jgi:hypothetical protein
MSEQRRGRKIAMSPREMDDFLTAQRTCRLGSVNSDGKPHVSPLWFVWDGTALWLNSIVKSQRWVNLMRNGNVSIVVDGGDDFDQLHGVELAGSVESVGEVPRTDAPDPRLAHAEKLFGDKYGAGTFVADGRHAWLRLVPEKVVSWDFRKMSVPPPPSD